MKDNTEQIARKLQDLKKLNQLQEQLDQYASALSLLTYKYRNHLPRVYTRFGKTRERNDSELYESRDVLQDLKDHIERELASCRLDLVDLAKSVRVIDHSDQSPNEDTTSSE